MKTLCELKRFKEKVTRGRFAGNETEFAICVGGDNYSWNINKVNINSSNPPLGQSYFKGFCHLLSNLSNFNIEVNDAIDKILNALQNNTGIAPSDELIKLIENSDNYKEIGKSIDNLYRSNYNNVEHDSGRQIDQDRIYIRILKAKIGSKD